VVVAKGRRPAQLCEQRRLRLPYRSCPPAAEHGPPGPALPAMRAGGRAAVGGGGRASFAPFPDGVGGRTGRPFARFHPRARSSRPGREDLARAGRVRWLRAGEGRALLL